MRNSCEKFRAFRVGVYTFRASARSIRAIFKFSNGSAPYVSTAVHATVIHSRTHIETRKQTEAEIQCV